MKICFFGSSLVSSYWNGAATYYRGLLKGLAGLGHEIAFYEPDAFERQRYRDMPDPAWAKVFVYPATDSGWQKALDEAAQTADVLVKASGVGVFDAELESAVPATARTGCVSIYWDVDAPATLEAMHEDPHHHLRRAIPRYDLVLTYGGGPPVVEAYEGFGAKRCVTVYNAVDPDTHFPAPVREDFRCSLSFLGNRLPDRETRVEEFFLKAARLMNGKPCLLGGAGWDDKPLPRNVRHVGHVGTDDHCAFFGSGLATLNVNRASMANYGFSPPTRIFEAAGAGACIISDSWKGVELFLEPGEEILIANDGLEVAALIAELTPERAQRIGQRARRRVLSEHSYRHRGRQVAAILAGN